MSQFAYIAISLSDLESDNETLAKIIGTINYY